MIAENGRDYKDLPHLTEGDEEFRSKFLSWDLGNLSFVDVQEYLKEKDTILVPMASFEQHGPHLPIYTDTITCIEMARRVAEMIAVLHTPPIWMGYSPQHMFDPGMGRGTITVRSSVLLNLVNDIARSLIHHGFNRIIFINGHGSNVKVIDPVLRKETSQDLAWNEEYVRMDRANFTKAHIPDFLPKSFEKKDGMPDVEFEGYKYFTFPMDHHEFIETGVIGNPLRATKEKGEESFRRLSEHVARGVLELQEVPVTVHPREFIDRVL